MTQSDLTIVAFSDTHGLHAEMDHAIPEGDVLIHAGDFCRGGMMDEVRQFAAWLGKLPHRHKLVTPGNHDRPVEEDEPGCRALFDEQGIQLLIGETTVIEGFQFYGAPFTPTFGNWHFMRARGAEIRAVWEAIPEDADVVITHGPAYGHGDRTIPWRADPPRHAGCFELLARLRVIQPNLHIFGHIHEDYGATISDELPSTRFLNVSTCTASYHPENAPMRIQLKRR